MRKLAIGSDLVKTSRKLDRAEAAAFMRQIAVDPAVAHVEVDRMRRPVRDLRAQARVQPQAFTPDDTYYGAYQWHLKAPRSEEHTSELQSLMRISYAVFCLKKTNKQ